MNKKIKCQKCKGIGLDLKNLWDDNSPSYCEQCDGYGERMIVKCKCQDEQERVFLFRVKYIKQEETK